jgi:hypothetical protein
MGREPECAKLLRQTEVSLGAIRLHLANFQQQLLLLSSIKATQIVDTSEDHEQK